MNELSSVADFLMKYGPWAILIIEGYVIRWLFLRYDSIQEKRIAEGRENGVLAKTCADALENVRPLLASAEARLAATDMRLKKMIHDEAT